MTTTTADTGIAARPVDWLAVLKDAAIIGLTAAYSDAYIGSKWTQVVIFGILIGVLVFKPTGLLGMRVPEK